MPVSSVTYNSMEFAYSNLNLWKQKVVIAMVDCSFFVRLGKLPSFHCHRCKCFYMIGGTVHTWFL